MSVRDGPWGFVTFRTYYGDDKLWETVKAKLNEAKEAERNSIEEAEGVFDSATLVFMDDKDKFENKTMPEIRL